MALLAALALTAVAILSAVSLAFSWITLRDLRKLLAAFDGPPSSGPRPRAQEEFAMLEEATIARIDALATEEGLTREAMILRLVKAGAREALGLPPDDDAPGPPPSGRRLR